MEKKEHKTFNKILELVLKQGAASKDILDELKLLHKMRLAKRVLDKQMEDLA